MNLFMFLGSFVPLLVSAYETVRSNGPALSVVQSMIAPRKPQNLGAGDEHSASYSPHFKFASGNQGFDRPNTQGKGVGSLFLA